MGVETMKYYIHHVPGRIRIETPFIHENPSNAQQFEADMKVIIGILSIKTDHFTGSAIILYDEKTITYEQVVCILEERKYFKLLDAQTLDEKMEKASENVLKFAEKIVESSLGEGFSGG